MIYESMTKAVGPFTVRVWREEPRRTIGGIEPVKQVRWDLSRSFDMGARVLSADLTADCLESVPRVSTYEITDRFGNGGVVYVVWP